MPLLLRMGLLRGRRDLSRLRFEVEQLHEHLGPRFEPPQLLRDMVAEGRLGKKAGRGFYTWND